MIILYETKDGERKRTDNHRDIPKGCKRILIKHTDNKIIRLPKCERLVINSGYTHMSYISFECNILSVYNVKRADFSLRANSKVVELRHLDMRNIRHIDCGFMGSSLRKICNLDFKNVKTATGVFVSCKLDHIPDIINYSHIENNIFDRNSIDKIKLSAWKKMMKIKR